MRFKIDENLPEEAVIPFAQNDLEAETVYSEDLSGAEDSELVAKCQAEERILVTMDLDFSNIKSYPPENYAGFIVLRLSNQDKDHIINILTDLSSKLEIESPKNSLWIVEKDRIRIYDEK